LPPKAKITAEVCSGRRRRTPQRHDQRDQRGQHDDPHMDRETGVGAVCECKEGEQGYNQPPASTHY
jgi:hypothetical protein